MATNTINSSTLTSGQDVTLATLKKCLDRLLDLAERNQIQLGVDEYQLLNAIRYGTTTGSGTVTAVVMTYT